MPRIIQVGGSTTSDVASQLGQGLLAYQAGLADYKERKAKTDLAAEQAREKKIKSDQIEAYQSAVSGLGTQMGAPASTSPGFTGPQEQDAYKNTIFWKSDVATELREAQETGKGAYPDYVMNSAPVQQALWDVEAVSRASQRAGLYHPDAAIRSADDQALQDALEAKLRAVRSALDLETRRQYESKASSFVGEIRTVKDDRMDAVYGDKLRDLRHSIEEEGGTLQGLRDLENLRDEFYEQLAKKKAYEGWASEATKFLDDDKLVKAYAARLDRKGVGLGDDPEGEARKKLLEFSTRTLTGEELNDPAKASQAFEQAKLDWTEIKLAVEDIDGVPRQTYEAQAENYELQWMGAFGTLRALNRGDESAKALLAQFLHLKDTAPVPQGLVGEEAARYKLSYAAQALNGLLSEQGKSPMPEAFLYGLLQEDFGAYAVEQVKPEHNLLGETVFLGDAAKSEEEAKVQPGAAAEEPKEKRGAFTPPKTETPEPIVKAIAEAKTKKGVVDGMIAEHQHYWENREVRSSDKAFRPDFASEKPMSEKQLRARANGFLKGFDREWSDMSETITRRTRSGNRGGRRLGVFGFTKTTWDTESVVESYDLLKKLGKERRDMYARKAFAQLTEGSWAYTRGVPDWHEVIGLAGQLAKQEAK